jgi:hypothetical protein
MLPQRRAWLEAQGYAPLPYQAQHAGQAELILLCGPVRVGKDFIRADAVWARYFRDKRPEVILLQAGLLDRAMGPNYLHWSALPQDFGAFLRTCRSTGQGWMPPDNREIGLEHIWAQFWDGHNEAGFGKWISQVRPALQIAADNLKKGPAFEQGEREELDSDEKKAAFLNIQLSALSYWPYLSLVPFSDTIQEVRALLASIEPGWADCADYESLKTRILQYNLQVNALDDLLEGMSKYFKTDTP